MDEWIIQYDTLREYAEHAVRGLDRQIGWKQEEIDRLVERKAKIVALLERHSGEVPQDEYELAMFGRRVTGT